MKILSNIYLSLKKIFGIKKKVFFIIIFILNTSLYEFILQLNLPPFGVAKIIDDTIESKMNFFSEQITNVPCYLSIGLPVKISPISIDDWKSKAIKFYDNAKTQRNFILEENSGKSGIYLWYNRKNGKSYIGQSINLGDKKKGRLIRYYHNSYLNSNSRGESKIRLALIKYGHDNFSLAILEYCPTSLLDEREQFWIDLISPEYNILTFVKSSRGYKHTIESIQKMRGPRPNYKPSPEHLEKLAWLAKKENRDYKSPAYIDKLSKINGTTVYVYDATTEPLNLITTYSSIIRVKKAYGIKMHHNTLYKHISAGMLFKGHKFSFTPLNSSNNNHTIISLANLKKARKIEVTNVLKPELSKSLNSLTLAAAYIREIDGVSDRGIMRKYINSGKLYRKKWKLVETNLMLP